MWTEKGWIIDNDTYIGTSFFFIWTQSAACEHHCQATRTCQDEEQYEKCKIGLQGKAMSGSFTMTLILDHPFFYMDTHSNL